MNGMMPEWQLRDRKVSFEHCVLGLSVRKVADRNDISVERVGQVIDRFLDVFESAGLPRKIVVHGRSIRNPAHRSTAWRPCYAQDT